MISGDETVLLELQVKKADKKALNENSCPAADTEPFFAKGTNLFEIELLETGERVGIISLLVDKKNRSGRLDFEVVPEKRGQGIATDAVAAFLRFVFSEYGINRVYSFHSVKNPAAGVVLRKVGMSYEGMSREAFYNAAGYHDTHNYAILKREVI